MATAFYKHKDRDLPRFLYRRLADSLATAGDASARVAAIAGFADTLDRETAKGDYLKFKWVLPDFLATVLTVEERRRVEDALARRRGRQSARLFDAYPHCADEFSLDPAFLAAAFDAAPVPLFSTATPIFTLGSCFARNIAAYLAGRGFATQSLIQAEDLNSPFSNAVLLSAAAADESVRAAYVNGWLNAMLKGNSAETIAAIAAQEMGTLADVRAKIAASELLIITLGNTVDYHLDSGATAPMMGAVRVAPKFLGFSKVEDVEIWAKLSAMFRSLGARLRLATHAETLNALGALHAAVRGLNPTAPIVYTLSPVPIDSAMGLAKPRNDGPLETDCISKSTLRAAIAEFLAANRDAGASYFPSYEIVRWLGAMLPFPAFGAEDAAARHVSADILSAVYDFFLRKHGPAGGAP